MLWHELDAKDTLIFRIGGKLTKRQNMTKEFDFNSVKEVCFLS